MRWQVITPLIYTLPLLFWSTCAWLWPVPTVLVGVGLMAMAGAAAWATRGR